MIDEEIIKELKEKQHNPEYHDLHHVSDSPKGYWYCECGEKFEDKYNSAEHASNHTHLECRLEYTDRDVKIGLSDARKDQTEKIINILEKLREDIHTPAYARSISMQAHNEVIDQAEDDIKKMV